MTDGLQRPAGGKNEAIAAHAFKLQDQCRELIESVAACASLRGFGLRSIVAPAELLAEKSCEDSKLANRSLQQLLRCNHRLDLRQ